MFDFVTFLIWNIGFLYEVHLLRQICRVFGQEIDYSDLLLPFSAVLTALCRLLLGDWYGAGVAVFVLAIVFAITLRINTIETAGALLRFVAISLESKSKPWH